MCFGEGYLFVISILEILLGGFGIGVDSFGFIVDKCIGGVGVVVKGRGLVCC